MAGTGKRLTVVLVLALIAGACSSSETADQRTDATRGTSADEQPPQDEPLPVEDATIAATKVVELGGGSRVVFLDELPEGSELQVSTTSPPPMREDQKAIVTPIHLELVGAELAAGASIEFPLPPGLPADEEIATDLVGIATYDEVAGQWVDVPVEIDLGAGVMRAFTTHFSWWKPWEWDWVSIGARINQRAGQIAGKRAAEARCPRGQPVPSWVSMTAGVSNDAGLIIRSCAEGEGDTLVVEMVNNRPYGQILRYGAPVAWGWHEDGGPAADRVRNVLLDALMSPEELYLPPLSAASVGIARTTGHKVFHIAPSGRTVIVDAIHLAAPEALTVLGDRFVDPFLLHCGTASIWSLSIGPSLAEVRDSTLGAVGCFETAVRDALAKGSLSQAGAEQALHALRKLTIVLRTVDVTWLLGDWLTDRTGHVPDLGAGFSLLGRQPVPEPTTRGPSGDSGVRSPEPQPTQRETPTAPPRTRPTPTPTTPEQSRTIRLRRGAAAEHGYWYDVSLSGFPANRDISVRCRDSVDPQGFHTATVRTNGSGNARHERVCFSGDGPDHWVTAGGVTSNKVQWSAPAPPPPPPPAPSPAVTLRQGASAQHGYWYDVTLSGFPANRDISVRCHDSVDPQGFHTATLRTNGSGNARHERVCFSGDGPDHWVTAGGVTSNKVRWGASAPPPAPSPAVTLRQGASAQHGYWYDVTLSGFPANRDISVRCHDSVDPQGFHTATLRTNGSGNARHERVCFSGDGPDHWVTAGGVTSNKVRW